MSTFHASGHPKQYSSKFMSFCHADDFALHDRTDSYETIIVVL